MAICDQWLAMVHEYCADFPSLVHFLAIACAVVLVNDPKPRHALVIEELSAEVEVAQCK